MELILLEKVAQLGDPGDLVKVKSGYGRNFLIPTGKAVAGSLLLLRTPLGPSHNSNCERPNRSMF